MKITIDIDPCRDLWEEVEPELHEVQDAQLILWSAQSDWKDFAFEVADKVAEELEARK